MPRSPKKKWTGLREKSAKRKEEELHNKLIVDVANVEYEYGKYFYEFFYTACNLILYYRGLHSNKFFSFKESRMFSLQIPYMRFPETIVYLEKVSQKAVNLLLAGYLDAFMFEERDRYGNSMLYMIRLNGQPTITRTYVLLKEEIFSELKEACETLLQELKRTLTSMRPITQPTMFRWKVQLGLKKVDRPDSKWRNNNQGIFIDDPDSKNFPWWRSTREKRKSTGSSQDPLSPPSLPSSPVLIRPASGSSIIPIEDASEEFFGPNNFQDVELEEDMGDSPVKKDYEKEGFTIIEYPEDSGDGRPGSPDMFAESSSSPPTPPPASNSSAVSYHMYNGVEGKNDFPSPSTSGAVKKPVVINARVENTLHVDEIDSTNANGGTLPQNNIIFPPMEPDKDSSTEDFRDATNIFDDFDDFQVLDKALEMLDQDDGSFEDFSVPILSDTSENSSDVKFFAVATERLLDTLMCNILVFKDTQADKLHSDYKPALVRKKGKRFEK